VKEEEEGEEEVDALVIIF